MASSSIRRIDRTASVQAPHGYYPDRDAPSRAAAYRRYASRKAKEASPAAEQDCYRPGHVSAILPCPSSPMPLKLSFDEQTYTVRTGESITFNITLLMSNGLKIDMSETAHLHLFSPQIVIRQDQEWRAVHPGETLIEAIAGGLRATARIRVLD
jgi:hypothetical protein